MWGKYISSTKEKQRIYLFPKTLCHPPQFQILRRFTAFNLVFTLNARYNKGIALAKGVYSRNVKTNVPCIVKLLPDA